MTISSQGREAVCEERTPAEAALREKEQLLHNLADNLPNVVVYQVMATPDGGRCFTYVGRGVEQLNEFTAEELMADATLLYSQMLPEYREVVREREAEALRNVTPVRVEVQSRLPSGRVRWFAYTSTPRRLPDGAVAWDGVEVDITARKEAEEALERRVAERTAELSLANQRLEATIEEHRKAESLLRDSEERFRSLYMASRDAIMVVTPDRGFLAANPATVALFACRDEQEFTNHTPASLSPERQPDGAPSTDKSQEMMRLALERGSHFFEWTHCRADGAEFPATVMLSRIEHRGTSALTATVRDITREKTVENALRETNEYLENLFNRANAPIIVWNAQLRITRFNRAFELLTGRPADTVIGQPLEILFPPERVESSMELIRKALAGEHWETIEIEILRTDGTVRTVFWNSATILDPAGQMPVATIAQGQDITERKKAEEELRGLQELYQAVVEDQTEVICRLNPEGQITFANDTFCRFFGRGKGELIGRVWTPCAHSGDVERVRHGLGQLSPENPVVVIENRVISGNGAQRWMQFVNRGFFDTEGNLREIQSVGRDVSERKQMEGLLKESEARYRALFDQAVDGIVFMSIDGAHLVVNEAFALMHGYDHPREMESVRLEDLETSETAQLRPERLRRLIDGESMTFEVEHFRKDRSVFPLDVSCRVIRVGGERYLLGFHRDITDRKKTEAALRESEAKYRTLIEESIQGIGITKGNRVVFANRALVEMFGYDSLEQAVHIPLLDFFAPESREKARQRLEQRESGQPVPQPGEYKAVRKDGSIIDVQTQSADIVIGNERLTQTAFRDVTELKKAEAERRHLEAQLQYAQKLESLGVLAGGIAHDFNNVLNLVFANVHHAKKVLSELSPARPFVDNIERSAGRAAALTRQMLAYSGKGSFRLEVLEIGEIVAEMVHLVQSSVSKKAALRVNLASDLPPVEADPAQVQQVVMNLILNACEALDEELGGLVTVSARALHCVKQDLLENKVMLDAPEGDYVCVEVTDTGSGMSEETKDRLFDPFFTTKFTGRGLGMSAVLGIMRAHHGAILVDSGVGKGTTVRVFFPVSARPLSQAAEAAREAPTAMSRRTATILFVDDEVDMLDLGALALRQMGYEVLTAANGGEAIEIFETHAGIIDCVLLDLGMPYMDGAQTLAELRRINPEVRVILASGYTEHEIQTRLAGQTVQALVVKPYDFSTLQTVLQEVLS